MITKTVAYDDNYAVEKRFRFSHLAYNKAAQYLRRDTNCMVIMPVPSSPVLVYQVAAGEFIAPEKMTRSHTTSIR